MNPSQSKPAPEAVRAALTRILASQPFQCCEPQARLLRKAVENSLADRHFQIKPGPAAELRTRLEKYYAAAGASETLRIEIPADGSAAIFSTRAVPAEPAKSHSRWMLVPVILAAAGLLTWAGSILYARMASAQIRSLAILPFADLTPGSDQPWFATSFAGEILDDLARAPGINIVARSSAFRVKGDARVLGAAAILTGSLTRTGRKLQLTLQMVRSADGYRLWSASFDPSAADLRAAQQAIALAIARRLHVSLPAAAPIRHPLSGPAYDAYLEGRYWFDLGTPDGLNRAAARLEDSTRLDPEFARAWAWLSIVREYRVAAAMARPNQAMPGSRDAAERAVALAPAAADSHLALGIVKLQYDWDWPQAKKELDCAVESAPGSAFALAWHARWYASQGRAKEAAAEIERALQFDPLNPALLHDAASESIALHQPDRAIAFAQKAADQNPDDPTARAALAEVLLAAGQKDKSRQVVEQLRDSPAGAKLPPSVLPSLAARMGDPESAREMLDAAEDLPDDQLLPAVDYAQLAASIQDWDRLFSWTEEAYGERDVALPYWRDCPLIPKSDPRYDAFLAEMNLAAPADR